MKHQCAKSVQESSSVCRDHTNNYCSQVWMKEESDQEEEDVCSKATWLSPTWRFKHPLGPTSSHLPLLISKCSPSDALITTSEPTAQARIREGLWKDSVMVLSISWSFCYLQCLSWNVSSSVPPLALKGLSVAWEGPLLQTCTWMGRRFRAQRRQMGVEVKMKRERR